MKTCSKCGSENEDFARNCKACNAELEGSIPMGGFINNVQGGSKYGQFMNTTNFALAGKETLRNSGFIKIIIGFSVFFCLIFILAFLSGKFPVLRDVLVKIFSFRPF